MLVNLLPRARNYGSRNPVKVDFRRVGTSSRGAGNTSTILLDPQLPLAEGAKQSPRFLSSNPKVGDGASFQCVALIRFA